MDSVWYQYYYLSFVFFYQLISIKTGTNTYLFQIFTLIDTLWGYTVIICSSGRSVSIPILLSMLSNNSTILSIFQYNFLVIRKRPITNTINPQIISSSRNDIYSSPFRILGKNKRLYRTLAELKNKVLCILHKRSCIVPFYDGIKFSTNTIFNSFAFSGSFSHDIRYLLHLE